MHILCITSVIHKNKVDDTCQNIDFNFFFLSVVIIIVAESLDSLSNFNLVLVIISRNKWQKKIYKENFAFHRIIQSNTGYYYSNTFIYFTVSSFRAKLKNLECLHSTFRTFDCYQAFKEG